MNLEEYNQGPASGSYIKVGADKKQLVIDMLDKIVELAPVQMLDGRHVEVFLSTEYWEAFAVDSCDAVAWWEYRGIRVAVNRYQDIDAVVNVNE